MIDDLPRAVLWERGELSLLDQRKLPHVEEYRVCRSVEDVFDAISTLTVRGAPAIGIAAAYGLLVEPSESLDTSAEFERRCDYLISARPTAVNLAWAVNRMRDRYACIGDSKDRFAIMEEEARSIHQEDARACHAIADVGYPIVKANPRVLTHCNAGSLAVSEMGTALAPIYRAHEKGIKVHVYVDETRPLLQGARLTAYELQRSGVDCTLIADNMAAHIISESGVDMVLVGADRIAANGDAANKIGTLNLAILCQYFRIPFYVAAPVSTIDPDTKDGEHIIIEERDPDEVKVFAGTVVAPPSVKARSPAFDVTPNALIAGIMTEKGLLEPPYFKSISSVIN